LQRWAVGEETREAEGGDHNEEESVDRGAQEIGAFQEDTIGAAAIESEAGELFLDGGGRVGKEHVGKADSQQRGDGRNAGNALEIAEPEKKQSDDGDGRDGDGARNFKKERIQRIY
jgi:hypothetical protein